MDGHARARTDEKHVAALGLYRNPRQQPGAAAGMERRAIPMELPDADWPRGACKRRLAARQSKLERHRRGARGLFELAIVAGAIATAICQRLELPVVVYLRPRPDDHR